MPAGRPSIYSEELADRICDRIACGESVRRICLDEDMPDRRQVLRWQNDKPDFAAKCARAREGQADWLAEDMAEIEDLVISGSLDPQAARVAILSKQWRASKLAPKKYGEKVSTEISGPGGGPVETVDLTPLETARRLAFALQKGRLALEKPSED